jgi:hypothetical protein
VYSDPVGVVKYNLPVGMKAVGFPMVNPVLFSGIVDGVTANSVSVAMNAGSPAVGTVLSTDVSYFVEFVATTGGPNALEGDRVEIDVAATKDAGNPADSVVLNFDPAFLSTGRNTLGNLPIDLVGYRLCIRAHVTISQVFGTGFSSPMQSGTSPTTGDQVYVFSNGGFVTYLFQQDRGGTYRKWVRFPEGTDADSAAIPSGTGLFVMRIGSTAVDLSQVGSARINDFVQPLQAGYTFIGEPVAVDQSFASRGMVQANGFVPGRSPADADNALVWTGAGYKTYYYLQPRSGSPYWVDFSDPSATDVSNDTSVFSAIGAVLIKKATSDPDYVVPNPL